MTSTKHVSARQARQRPRGAQPRRGMTLIEVILSLVIISVAMISISVYMAKFAQGILASDVKATAEDIASTQIESAKTAPRYSAIDTLYPGTVAMPSPYTGFTRQTLVTHTGGGAADLYDYKTITVIVTNTRLQTPVEKTDIIAAF
ncbi:MAG TPA: prepilin-type N-terminal cleavage/methylation domain-containing protein [Gemmatimonadaceae bacterium]|jgi:prepilin-type N-terminal cleavage/methylation domain-containing protein|nr:prepilin-type N-terminal cleavage/methylation domain-containing protein [Gemmatimonadaceae bacterium]